MSITHGSFTLERTYDADVARVFKAWADPEAKAIWFAAGDSHALDFRVGGREHNQAEHEGSVYRYEALYHDIRDDERIVYTYDMYKDDQRISVSLGTIELAAEGDGTRLVYTETGAFFDGADTPDQRQGGTEQLFDALGRAIESVSA
jgi:uncharacterized protein YndB with AHSA1/START domain